MKKAMVVVAVAAVVSATAWGVFVGGQVNAEKTKVREQHANFAPAHKAVSSTTVKEKMLNAVDFYKDLQGKATYISNNVKLGYEFVIQQGEHPASYVKTWNLVTQEVQNETYYDGTFRTEYSHHHNYKQVVKPMQAPMAEQEKKATERHYKNSENENFYEYRNDPSGAQVDMVFPQVFAFWLDDFDKNYSIAGTDTFLDRQATIVEGKLPSQLARKFKAQSFKFWVDTETGILLKSSVTDEAGQVMLATEITELAVDQGVKLDESMLRIPSDVKDLKEIEKEIQAANQK